MTGRVSRRDAPRGWRKIRIEGEGETSEVRAVGNATSDIGDAPVLSEPPAQIPAGDEIASMTADAAYDMRPFHDTIAARSAVEIAPSRRRGKPWKPVTPGAITRSGAVRASERSI